MPVDPHLALLLTSNQIGDGEPDLGARLMNSFLTSLLSSGQLPTKMMFMGTGIFLTTEGSPVLDLLTQFQDVGAEILSCGTCLEYYDRVDKLLIGQPTNMNDTVDSLLSYKIISP